MHARRIVACTIFSAALAVSASAQVPGQNVNMVAGTTWPGGDPFLQRQNEPSMAVSSRNPLHLLAGANDYRTVDLPGLPDGGVTGDAWLGLFKSTNGGGRWTSTLLPGYPQDTSPEGLASPLKGLQAGADAFIRPGSHGLLYFSGLAFNRGEGQPSAIFVARYQDRNNKESGDPFQYQGTSIVARNARGEFLDKPTLAADIPRGSAACNINGTATPAGAVYAAWTVFLSKEHPHAKKDADDDDKEGESGTGAVRSRIVFARSANCGTTWSRPVTLSDSRTNQGASIAIDPRNGHIYVAWRQFETWDWIHAILVVKSTDGGRSFSRPVPIWGFFPFDQGTTGTSFRTNSYPTIAVDHTGRVYAAWAARAYAPGNHNPFTGDARIVVATSRDGRFWTFPRAVDNFPGRGHQIMPALTYAGGKLQLVYYDLREDVSGFFEQFVDELSILRLPPGTPGKRRHTVDVRGAQADPDSSPRFASYAVTPIDPSLEASRYLIGSRPGSGIIEQLQFNPPNLPLFGLGTVPFIGDYVDLAARTILPDRGPLGQEVWRYSRPGDDAVFHLVWADNRDVRPPMDGNWANYTPPTFSGSGGPSLFDPTQSARVCVPGQAGMRNQNLYTSRISPGLVAGSPGNAKPLSTSLPRAFVVFAQNTTQEMALYRFSIRNQPAGGAASFEQFAALAQVDVLVPAGSSAARTVFVTSTDPRAAVLVDIVQIAGVGVPPPPPEGRSSTVVLNPDISNPDISNPDISNPDISNPDISNAEVHNPDISNPDISNPDISNPDISNPDISNPDISNIEVANPDISNPDISNPDISNPDISNPDISNPDISNPDISNGSITDYSYEVTNNGNTASEFELDIEETDPLPTAVKLQLVIHRTYQTPVVDGCTLKLQTQNQVLLNLPRPLDFSGPITFWLEPGQTIKVTFRVIDTDRDDGITWDPRQDLDITVTAAAVNWDSEEGPDEEPASDTTVHPVANDDAYDAVEGQFLTVPAPGVMANDEIPEEEDVHVELVSNTQHGEIELRPDGSFTYISSQDFVSDEFTYRLVGGLISGVATVRITITPSGNPLQVVTTSDSGPGSLRAAIEFANSHENGEGVDVISFDIPGEGATRRILLLSLLPAVTDPVDIDGTTQPGYEGTPVVILDGNDILPEDIEGGYGLAILAGDSRVRGLSIVNTPGKGVILSAAGGNTVERNWIGVDAFSGAAGPTHEAGVAIMNGSSGNVIGVTCQIEGPCLAGGANLISGNEGAGVHIYEGSNNAVRGNRIGTTANGLAPLPNGEGVGVGEGANNRIGGARPGEGNLISGNLGAGVAVRLAESQPEGTVIAGNFIGVSSTGGPLGNGGDGVLLQDVAGVLVGGTALGARNVIAGNLNGVRIAGVQGNGNTVRGNYIGISPSGVEDRGNTQNGVLVESASNIIRNNVISRNGRSGVRLLGAGAHGNTIQGNMIGTDANGSIDTFVVGNASAGVTMAGASDNLVGGLEEGQANLIADNDDKGIALFATNPEENPLTPVGNRFLSNNVYGNTGIGIDLGDDGQTPNDGPGDEDLGANRSQNHPDLDFFFSEAGIGAAVNLTSSFNSSFTIQLFITRGACGGPMTLLETRTVQTNSDGNASFSRLVPLSEGDGLWATATDDATGDTSEMRCLRFMTN